MGKVEQYLKKWILKKNGVALDKIDINVNMFESGYIDSLGVFGLLMDIEDDLEVELNEDDLLDRNSNTIIGLAKIIESKYNQKKV